jgi:hypothetical protein
MKTLEAENAYRQESFTCSRDVHVSCSHHTILFGRLILTSAPQENWCSEEKKKLKYQLKSKYAISIGQFHMMVIWRRVSTMQKHCGSLCTVNASALSINYYQYLSMTIDDYRWLSTFNNIVSNNRPDAGALTVAGNFSSESRVLMQLYQVTLSHPWGLILWWVRWALRTSHFSCKRFLQMLSAMVTFD